METEDKKSIKSKAFAISSLMRNDKLSKIIDSSFSSKVGSTRNNKARAILKSVYKADNNYNYLINDGKGGPGNQDSQSNNPFSALLHPPSQYSNASYQPTSATEVVTGIDNLPGFKWFAGTVSKDKPKSRVGEAVKSTWNIPRYVGEPIKEGIGFTIKDILYPGAKQLKELTEYAGQKLWDLPGSMYQWGMSEDRESHPYPFRFSGGVKPPEKTVSPVVEAYNIRKDVRDTIEEHFPGQDPFKEGTKANTWLNDWWNTKGKAEHKTFSPLILGSDPVTSLFKDPTKIYFKYSDSEDVYEKGRKMKHVGWDEAEKKNIWDKIETIERPTLGAGQVSEEPVTITDKLAGDPDLGTSKNITDMTDEELEEWLNQIGADNSLTDYLAPSIENAASLKEAIQAGSDLGLGAKTTMAIIWSDKAKLGEMLGMSEEAAKLLPEYMLSSQLIDLRSAKEDEHRINEQEDRIFKKQIQGLTIDKDLRDVIRGRDEYLGQIDKLLFDTRKSISEMDTSNPYVAERMGNYVNYLTFLKGKQSKRYIDFLDMSIRDFNTQLQTDVLMYDRSKAHVEVEIAKETALTAESHANIKDMLTEMYNNIEASEDRLWTLESREMARAEEKRRVANDILNQQITQMKINGYGVESDPVSPATFDKYKTFFGSEDENGNFVFDTYSPSEVLGTANVTQQNSGSVLTAFLQSVGRDIYGGASTGNVSGSNLSNFKNAIRSQGGIFMKIDEQDVSVNDITMDQLNAMTDEQKAEFERKGNNSIMKDKLEINLRKGIEDYLTSSEDKIRELREAIEDLSRMKEGAAANWSRDKYVRKNEGLGETAGFLYDYVNSEIGLDAEIRERAEAKAKEEGIEYVKTEPFTWMTAEEGYSQFSDEDLPYYISSDLAEYLMY